MQKMNKFDDVTKENIDEHNPNWPQIPDHPYRILIVRGSESKKNALLNFIKRQDGDEYSILIKFIHVLKIQMKQSIKILLKKWKNGLENPKSGRSKGFYWIIKKYKVCL